ncbi:MAG: patatin-like phospholipase family protein [Candidatus Berkiella sp.]
MYKNLALEGGGTKGHIYMGAAVELERLGVLANIDCIAGASVGAIAALLLATGWPVKKIQDIYSKMDFETMAMGNIIDKAKVPFNIDNKFGAFKGKAFYTWFKELIKEATTIDGVEGDPNTTFRQWHALKEKNPKLKFKDIFVEACNLETGYNETFSHLGEHAEVPIADAIFASMKFPIFFTPFEIKDTLFFDGGTQRNCPSEVFEKNPGEYNPQTLSIRLDHQNEINYYEKGIKPPRKRPKNIFQSLAAQFGAATNAQDYNFFSSPYKSHTIFATTLEVGTLDFDLTQAQKDALFESGQYSVMCYFHQNHPELTVGKYDPKILQQLEEYGFPTTITEFKEVTSPPIGKKAPPRPITPMRERMQEPLGKVVPHKNPVAVKVLDQIANSLNASRVLKM